MPAPHLLPLFRSRLQLDLLALLLLNPEQHWTAAELEDRSGGATASVHRELRRALDAGLVLNEPVGRVHRYRADTSSPLYEPLSLLLDRTVGLESQLTAVLEDLPGVEAAVLHGSWVAGGLSGTSDVDLLVVGDLEPARVLRAVRPIERRSGRTVDFVVIGPREYREKLTSGNGFIEKVAAAHRTLVGALPTSAVLAV